MKLHVALLTLTLMFSGSLAAEEQAESASAEQLAACTQSGEEIGLQGEELQTFISECMSNENKKEGDA
jgi:hypothetical protein